MSHEPSNDLVLVEDDEVVEGEQTPEMVASQIAERSAELARLTQEAVEISVDVPESGGALVPTNQTAQQAKRQIAALRADAMRQTERLREKQDEMEAVQDEIKDLMRVQMALAEATLAPIQKYVARLQEGIWMVNLYLGRDEEILPLLDGEPAPADEPVVIRQMVLAMDEECAINPDEDGIDATNIEEFDEWLKASPAHVMQVAPDPKCVVALRPRWRSKDYGDPWKNRAVAEEDAKTYFLIRNGDRLWRTWTEFQAGDRLVPTADEFASFFYVTPLTFGFDRKKPKHHIPIMPGTPAWERAEEAADARKRHFMRVGLILQGLVDRTTVFHPMPEGGINFMDYEQGGKTWRFSSDGEMLLGTGRKPYYEWLNEKNAQLRVGMRIVGTFGRYYRDGESPYSVRPRGASGPPTGELLMVEEASTNNLVVRYPRTDKVWKKEWVETRPGWGYHGHVEAEPKVRASATIERYANFILPFDLVTEEEVLVYLGARLDRHNYAEMFPLLKAAISAKRAERREEAPFKAMLVGVLSRDTGCGVDEAAEAVDSLVEWWKLTNKNHRPLVGDEKSQAKAVRMIVAEHVRRVEAARKGVSDEIVAMLLKAHPDALLIGRSRDGRYAAFVPHGDGPFVARHNFTARGIARAVEEWKLLRKATLSALTIAYASEKLEGWNLNASLRDHLTGPEYDHCVEMLTKNAVARRLVAVAYYEKKHAFFMWEFESDAVLDEAHPISGKNKGPKVKEQERRWSRRGRDAILGPSQHSNRSHYSSERKPWDTRSKHKGSIGMYDHEKANLYVVAYHDEMLDQRVESEKERTAAQHERNRVARAEAHAWVDTIKGAWIARREAEVYARFLEDYLDPELWEGHRKTLDRDTFEYPHSHWGPHWDGPDMVGAIAEHAVEEEIDLAGLTVMEAATQHRPSDEWLARRLDLSRSHKRDMPQADDVPEDIRDLRFARPEPEPEDDE